MFLPTQVGWRASRYSGWGIFEAMDMTAAMGWENVMTLYGHDLGGLANTELLTLKFFLRVR